MASRVGWLNNRGKVVGLLQALQAAQLLGVGAGQGLVKGLSTYVGVWLLQIGVRLLKVGVRLLKVGVRLLKGWLLLLKAAVWLLDCWKILLLQV